MLLANSVRVRSQFYHHSCLGLTEPCDKRNDRELRVVVMNQ